MKLKCNKCNEIFDLNTDGFEEEQIESDQYSIRYNVCGSIYCPECGNTINIESYDYWIDNISNEIVDGTEMLECSGATKI